MTTGTNLLFGGKSVAAADLFGRPRSSLWLHFTIEAALVRRHLEGFVAWAQTRQTNGFLEALNGLFQAAKRRARGFTRFDTIRTVIFLIAGMPDFGVVNPHAR